MRLQILKNHVPTSSLFSLVGVNVCAVRISGLFRAHLEHSIHLWNLESGNAKSGVGGALGRVPLSEAESARASTVLYDHSLIRF